MPVTDEPALMPRNRAERRAVKFRHHVPHRLRTPRQRSGMERALRKAFRGVHPVDERRALYTIGEGRLLAFRTGRGVDPGYRDPQERRRKREQRRAREAAQTVSDAFSVLS